MTLRDIVERVDYWQHHPSLSHLGIAHWRFQVQWHDDGCGGDDDLMSEAAASAWPSDFYTDALLTFSEEAMQNPQFDGDDDRYIVHELLHVAMRDFDSAIEADLEDYMPPRVVVSHLDRIRHEKEGHIDALARVIVSLDRRAK